MKANENAKSTLGGWLLARFKSGGRAQPRLELLERITLAPKQSLALVEAEGRRLLVATSPEGAPTFYALDEPSRPAVSRQPSTARMGARVSW
jgi:flagellar biogenesis protein FliO